MAVKDMAKAAAVAERAAADLELDRQNSLHSKLWDTIAGHYGAVPVDAVITSAALVLTAAQLIAGQPQPMRRRLLKAALGDLKHEVALCRRAGNHPRVVKKGDSQ